jgi:cobalt/nickel transport system permease protein
VDIGAIDYFANGGNSFLHRASTRYKIIFTVLVIASVVITDDFILLLSVYLILTAFVILTRLPFLKIISIASYPSIFALLFVIASWNGNWIGSGVIVFKALDAALAMVLLIVTTPYPEVFAALRPLLPKVVVEGLFLTYRSIFILLELIENLIKALRLRGGLTPGRYLKNIINFSSGIGLLLVRGFDLSERFYGVMRIRGYNGKMAELESKKLGKGDAAPILIGILVFALSLADYIRNDFSKYYIYALVVSILSVVITVSYAYIQKNRGLNWKN